MHRECGDSDLAIGRGRGRAGVVPLARPARKPDRLGRPSNGASPHRCSGGTGRARPRRHRSATTGRLPAVVRSRRGASILVRGGRLRPLDIDLDVAPRISERRLAVRIHGGSDPATSAAIAAQDEPVVQDGAVPCTSRRRGQSTTGLVTPAARRARRGLARGRDGSRAHRARPRPRSVARPVAIALRTTAAAPSLLDGVDRPSTSGFPPRGRGGVVRRASRGHISAAIRSSAALKTTAPRMSATTVSTTR